MMKHSLIFWICLIAAIGLFVGGFFVPPKGVIDGSVVTAAGILFGFATVGQIPHIIETSKMVKVTTGSTTIEAHGKDKENQANGQV